MNLHHTRMETD